MDGGLERRGRKALQEGVQTSPQSRTLPDENAAEVRRNKKSPSLAATGPFAEAWAKAQGQRRSHAQIVAREYGEAAGSTPIAELTPNLGNTLISRWREKWAADTVYVRRKELARFLRDLIEAGAPKLIEKTLAKVRKPQPRTTIATAEDLERLYKVANAKMRCFLAITVGHGLRRAEACRLCHAMYDKQRGTITYRTKGEATNTLPATDELRKFFEMAEPVTDPNEPLLNLIDGRTTYESIGKQWEKLKKKAGVNPELHIHDLRRTLAVKLYYRTHDLRLVQRTLGHANLAITCGYLQHQDPETIAPLLNELRPMPPAWKN